MSKITQCYRLAKLIEAEGRKHDQHAGQAAARATANAVKAYREEHPDAKEWQVKAFARETVEALEKFCDKMTKGG